MIDLTQKLQIDDLMIAVGTMNKEITQLKADKRFWIDEYNKKDKECHNLQNQLDELRTKDSKYSPFENDYCENKVGGTDV